MTSSNANHERREKNATASSDVYWRVEGSLLTSSAVRPLAFFTWNAHTFAERWARRGAIGLLALLRPLFYSSNRVFATRALHTVLRGVSRDRLDVLGEEYFDRILKPRLRPAGVQKLKEVMATGRRVFLVGQGLEHVLRPLARHLGVEYLIANRLEFRDGLATGRLLDPVIPPRGALALLIGRSPQGRVFEGKLCRRLGLAGPEALRAAAIPVTRRLSARIARFPVVSDFQRPVKRLSVRESFKGKQILLIGVTGFIGKVWLADVLEQLPKIGKVYVLVRRKRSTSALRRFERMLEESPVFDPLAERYGDDFPKFLSARIEVVEGDASQPRLGINPELRSRLHRSLDLIVNSSGLTDFNPDLRDALAANVDAVVNTLDFLKECDHAALLHLSTCYVAGGRDGRFAEELTSNYVPIRTPGFDAENEWRALHQQVAEAERRSESPEVIEELRREALTKPTAAKGLSGAALENQIRKNRMRWLRLTLTEAGTNRARELGWPNTYTLTKSLAESLIAKRGANLPIAVVRPSIVETSLERPFTGWNEGVNTSASLSYLLGTYFRQLPSNERKQLDLIPVDLACRGMTLIAAALLNRCHARVYQLATSVSNPCNMRRSIELTGLAHRKYYRSQDGFAPWLRSRFDPISVSKKRYERLSAPAQKAIVQRINRAASPFLKRPPLARQERDLQWIANLIELFEPFILHNQHVFEAENIVPLSEALPEVERAAFGYDPYSIDWCDYWVNVHVPALRRWSYPLIEGRPLEIRPPRLLNLPKSPKAPPTKASSAVGA